LPQSPPPFPKGSFDSLDGERRDVLGATDAHVGETFGVFGIDSGKEGYRETTHEIGSLI
jgi:hypothetical protein